VSDRRIRALALGVVRRGREILVFDAYDSVKRERFHRPLGGGIEFGELAENAVARELLEETGSEARVLRRLGVLENLFTFEGDPWHEIVFVFEAELLDRSVYERDAFEIVEVIRGEEVRLPAIWADPATLDAPLYPDGLAALIAESA
jgi:ADP-ribose pyrophosphatase YjhB (NUDIX family)